MTHDCLKIVEHSPKRNIVDRRNGVSGDVLEIKPVVFRVETASLLHGILLGHVGRIRGHQLLAIVGSEIPSVHW